jgi:hypothetical protein
LFFSFGPSFRVPNFLTSCFLESLSVPVCRDRQRTWIGDADRFKKRGLETWLVLIFRTVRHTRYAPFLLLHSMHRVTDLARWAAFALRDNPQVTRKPKCLVKCKQMERDRPEECTAAVKKEKGVCRSIQDKENQLGYTNGAVPAQLLSYRSESCQASSGRPLCQ